MEKRSSFDTAAQRYDATRPSYPDEVIDWIIGQTGIETDDLLLEIAPGTGQATLKFLVRGFSVHCVELGANLAALLREKCAGYPMTVDVSPFEEWVPKKPLKTRMIFCATAFHWLDPEVRYQKCHDLLMPGGFLTLLWNQAPRLEDPAVLRAYEILWEYAPEGKQSFMERDTIINRQKQEIQQTGLFSLEDYLDHKWFLSTSKAQYIESFFSQSSYLALPEDIRPSVKQEILNALAPLTDPFETPYHTAVYIAKRID